MKRMSLCTERDCLMTRLHPFAKLCCCLAAILSPLLSGALGWYGLTILLSLSLLASAGVLRRTLPLLAFALTILVTIFLIHGLFHSTNRTLLFALGPLQFYREGLLYALRIGLNLLNMLLSFALFVLTTRPADFVDALEQAGFSPRFGYMINSVFLIIPQMSKSLGTILEAQQSRGMRTNGNLFVRAKAFLPLITPVVSSALINTRERAIALEVRGFGSGCKKTFLKNRPLLRKDKCFALFCGLLIPAALLWRLLHVLS